MSLTGYAEELTSHYAAVRARLWTVPVKQEHKPLPVTLPPTPVARDILLLEDAPSEDRPKRILAYDVLKMVSSVSGVSIDNLRGNSRRKPVIFARHVSYSMMQKFCPHLTGVQITRVLKKDHSCRISSNIRVKKLLATEKEFSDLFWSVDGRLKEYEKCGFQHKSA